MTRNVLLALTAFTLAVPAFASAQGVPLVYRHELRQMVPAPNRPSEALAAAVLSPSEEIARHEAMAHAYRGTRIAQAATHCDRAIKQARDARKVQ